MEISLALGGGGVRGVAHIGVIKALEENDFKIRAIAGTSAGGLVGAVYAAGYSTDKIRDAVNEMDKDRSFSRNSDDHPSLLGLSGVTEKLSALLADMTFDDLDIPFAATAVSLNTGKEIILHQGKVLDAVLATIAIPGVFPSQDIGGRVLVDGGVLDPVPVRLARWMRPDLPVVAVVLHEVPDGYQEQDDFVSFPIPIPGPSSIVERLNKLRPVQVLKIFTRSIEVSSKHLTEMSMALYKPEVIISPPVGHIGVLQKMDINELIDIGMDAANKTIEQIKSEANWVKKIQRKVKHQINPEPCPDYWANIEG
jgi:NTE family protein